MAKPAFDVTLVTYERFPEGTPDDQLLLDSLLQLGARARFAVWSEPSVDWGASAVTVLRSTWDYHLRAGEFRAWLDAVEERTELVNSAGVVRWNLDKHYLRDLAARGVRCVPTAFVAQGAGISLAEICAAHGWRDVVVKPAISASAFGTKRFAAAALAAEGESHLRAVTAERAAMVQPYLAAIEHERERALVFIDGRYSHSYLKTPFNAGLTSAESREVSYPATAEEQAFGQAAIQASGASPAYARVDVVPGEDGPLLMELELIEPSLGFALEPAAGERLARALLARRPAMFHA